MRERDWSPRRAAVGRDGGQRHRERDLLRAARAARRPRAAFTADRKSRVGFALLAAAHSGGPRLYRIDGSAEAAQCRREIAWARATYRDDRSVRFDVDRRADTTTTR